MLFVDTFLDCIAGDWLVDRFPEGVWGDCDTDGLGVFSTLILDEDDIPGGNFGVPNVELFLSILADGCKADGVVALVGCEDIAFEDLALFGEGTATGGLCFGIACISCRFTNCCGSRTCAVCSCGIGGAG